jgi:hypothetical protein
MILQGPKITSTAAIATAPTPCPLSYSIAIVQVGPPTNPLRNDLVLSRGGRILARAKLEGQCRISLVEQFDAISVEGGIPDDVYKCVLGTDINDILPDIGELDHFGRPIVGSVRLVDGTGEPCDGIGTGYVNTWIQNTAAVPVPVNVVSAIDPTSSEVGVNDEVALGPLAVILAPGYEIIGQRKAVIQNLGPDPIYVGFTEALTTVAKGLKIAENGGIEEFETGSPIFGFCPVQQEIGAGTRIGIIYKPIL